MTHLLKPGFAAPFKAKTACNRTVDAKDCVGESPECETCHAVYLQQLADEREQDEAEASLFAGLDRDDPAEMEAA